MRKFEIWEEGQKFATIEARDAVSAVRKAARQFPRRAVDYNVEPGESYLIAWRACEPGQRFAARADVTVPGRGDRGCDFSEP